MELSSLQTETLNQHSISSPAAVTITRGSLSSLHCSPCAGCKFLRRKCQPNCIFAPYFPAYQPQKFLDVHRVFGASNLSKILANLLPHQRQEAAASLIYEAEMRLRDPVYGCVGVIYHLENQLQEYNLELRCASAELSMLESMMAARFAAVEWNPISDFDMQECFLPDWLQQQQRMMMTTTTCGEDYSVHPPPEEMTKYPFGSTAVMDSAGQQFGIIGSGGGGGEDEDWLNGITF